MIDLSTKYNHKLVEEQKYEEWLEKAVFSSGDKSKKPFTIVMPPPNVTGILHIGHAYNFSLQDIIIRRKRMEGYDALYLPGMDHAGIATQARVDHKLKEEGLSRYILGREKWLNVAWEWKEEFADRIREQWASLGLSVDYEKERFTLDDNLNKTVNLVFKSLYDKGLIYQGKRIISWDNEAGTALSNIEVEHKDTKGALYYITYPFKDALGGMMVATTRPETMFADTAIMVNPKDERYQKYLGKTVIIPTTNKEIPIIADDYVDMAFGTGCVKVTPAHDPNDYEVGKRHNLDMPICINPKGVITEMGGKYEGMDRFVCRKALVKDLQESGALIKIEPIVHSVAYSERTGSIVEPILSKQWFVKMKSLALQSLNKSQVNFIPERFKKTWQQWMENVEDWCISRQLWWGHRIPVWYKGDSILVGDEPTEEGYVQDEDVLDTWFSSALWPFSTLDYLNNSEEYQRRFPTDVLVTGYDIIFFWVSRMIFESLEFTGKDPFKQVIIHGLIRDNKGRKMSKSLGNGVDPIKEIEKYGCDTIRYFLTTSCTLGLDLKYDEEKVKSAWNYLNKIWNVSRYVLITIGDDDVSDLSLNKEELNSLDKWILTKENALISQVNEFYDKYNFVEVARYIYNFVYDDFASIYLELSKIAPERIITKKILKRILTTILKLLHPITPFITEDIFLKMYPTEISISLTSAAKVDDLIFKKDMKDMDDVIDLIKKVRVIRNEHSVSLSKPIELVVVALNDKTYNNLDKSFAYIDKFLNPSPYNLTKEDRKIQDAETIVTENLKVYIPLSGLINVDEMILSLENNLEKIEKEIERGISITSNANFLNKAPKTKKQEELDKLQKNRDIKENLLKELAEIKCLKK